MCLSFTFLSFSCGHGSGFNDTKSPIFYRCLDEEKYLDTILICVDYRVIESAIFSSDSCPSCLLAGHIDPNHVYHLEGTQRENIFKWMKPKSTIPRPTIGTEDTIHGLQRRHSLMWRYYYNPAINPPPSGGAATSPDTSYSHPSPGVVQPLPNFHYGGLSALEPPSQNRSEPQPEPPQDQNDQVPQERSSLVPFVPVLWQRFGEERREIKLVTGTPTWRDEEEYQNPDN